MEAAEGALEGVPFQTPRRVQSLEGAMNDNLKLRFLRDILFFHYELGNRRRDDVVIKQPTPLRTPGCSIGADNTAGPMPCSAVVSLALKGIDRRSVRDFVNDPRTFLPEMPFAAHAGMRATF